MNVILLQKNKYDQRIESMEWYYVQLVIAIINVEPGIIDPPKLPYQINKTLR